MVKILSSWKLRNSNLIILYNDKQLPPPSSFISFYTSVGEEILPITEIPFFNNIPKIVLTKNYRFTDELGDIAEFYRNNYLCMKCWGVVIVYHHIK